MTYTGARKRPVSKQMYGQPFLGDSSLNSSRCYAVTLRVVLETIYRYARDFLFGSCREIKSEESVWSGGPILSSERTPQIGGEKKSKFLKIISNDKKEKLVAGPRWWPDTRTD
jgi:hypothetical protein